jgi:hypothetical protein
MITAGDHVALRRLFDRNPHLRRDALTGLKIKLDRKCDREQPCRECCGEIREGKGPHRHALLCANCGSHRGWLSRRAADFLRSPSGRLSGLPVLHDRSIKP